MDAGGAPTPDPGGVQMPPPPAPAASADERAGGGWRALAVVLALALAFSCAVMVVAMLDIADTPLEDECRSDPTCTEYFDGSSAQKTATLILGFPSAALAGMAALLAVYFAGTGRRGRPLIQLTATALAVGAISILVGSV